MSHFTKVSTKVKDLEYIKKALTRMGLEFKEGEFNISWYGKTEKAEIQIDKAVGLAKQADGTYSMVGDFYHSQNQKLRKYYGNNQGFAADLGTAYAVEQAKGELSQQQFYCSENENADIGSDGMIRMVFNRYA
jgi:hypothetical protein